MASTTSSSTSKSGITTSANGERVIASSTRADGSVRKEIRVRPGYRPPEDVEVYKNRTAEAWKNRGKGGVPGAEAVDSAQKTSSSAAASKNSKRKEARKKAAAVAADGKDTAQGGENSSKAIAQVDGAREDGPTAVKEESQAVDPEVQKEKEARKLSKKLRQARDLKDKKDQGGALLPEQLEKVIRINELVRQLNALGFDAEGEKKEVAGEDQG